VGLGKINTQHHMWTYDFRSSLFPDQKKDKENQGGSRKEVWGTNTGNWGRLLQARGDPRAGKYRKEQKIGVRGKKKSSEEEWREKGKRKRRETFPCWEERGNDGCIGVGGVASEEQG